MSTPRFFGEQLGFGRGAVQDVHGGMPALFHEPGDVGVGLACTYHQHWSVWRQVEFLK